MTRRHPFLAVVAGLLLLAACGDDTATTDQGGTRAVEIDMVDIAFEPGTLEVAEGETVRFVLTNRGEIAHDACVGDPDAQAEHEAEMRDSGDAHDGHGDKRDAVTVEPGETAELTYSFDEPGTVEIGCHQPGHYAAGMKITLEVA